ncbi:MAG: hypothetical protein INH43_25415 [Acidobacteriaceae bacterium]|jgi:hypothetical protein|nr:hypothetical protein [Acidobacteriaceae bacterium]
MNPDTLIRRLKEAQAELARGLLITPSGRDAFEYGRAVGLYEGYERTWNLIANLFEESERGKFDI